MKIIVSCDKGIERKDMRKVECRKKGVKQERTRRKAKQVGDKIFIVCASSHQNRTYISGLSAVFKLWSPTAPCSRNRVITCGYLVGNVESQCVGLCV